MNTEDSSSMKHHPGIHTHAKNVENNNPRKRVKWGFSGKRSYLRGSFWNWTNWLFFKFPRVCMTINNMISFRVRDKWIPNRARVCISTVHSIPIYFYSVSNRFSLILFKGKVVISECIMILLEHERFLDIDSTGILLWHIINVNEKLSEQSWSYFYIVKTENSLYIFCHRN